MVQKKNLSLPIVDRCLVLCGPTASGKTEISTIIQGELKSTGINPAVIAVDSVTLFKGFDIGSAKPEKTENVHLVDVLDATDHTDASKFRKMALEVISSARRRTQLPFLVGGSGFYLKALLLGMTDAPPTDPQVEKEIRKELDEKTSEALYEKLKVIDPESADKISPNDSYRIIRALSVYRQSGKTVSHFRNSHLNKLKNEGPALKASIYYLDIPKAELKTRIESRTRKMLDLGLIEETRALLSKGLTLENCQPLSSIGYKQAFQFIHGEILSKEELQSEIVRETLRLAKAQRTWFKGIDEFGLSVKKFHPLNDHDELIRNVLNDFEIGN